MPDRIDLATLDDHRDAAQRAVAALAGGSLVGVAVAGAPALLASATALSALRLLGDASAGTSGRSDARPTSTLLLPDHSTLPDWAGPRSAAARKLPGRVWPGPVRLACHPDEAGLFGRLAPEARATLLDSAGRVTFQVTDDPILRSIVGLTAGPALLIEPPDGSEAGASPWDRAALVLDGGSMGDGTLPTVVRLDDEGWEVLRPGAVAESTLQELAGTILLFVCTGNTCRSPMAAAYSRVLLAQHLGCTVGDLPARGFTVESAGVGASVGTPASAHSVTIVRSACVGVGLDPVEAGLGSHRSRPVTADLARRADQIIAMTWDHLDALLERFPEVVDRVRLLDPDGRDIPDPYGSGERAYQATFRIMLPGLQDVLSPILGPRPV